MNADPQACIRQWIFEENMEALCKFSITTLCTHLTACLSVHQLVHKTRRSSKVYNYVVSTILFRLISSNLVRTFYHIIHLLSYWA